MDPDQLASAELLHCFEIEYIGAQHKNSLYAMPWNYIVLCYRTELCKATSGVPTVV